MPSASGPCAGEEVDDELERRAGFSDVIVVVFRRDLVVDDLGKATASPVGSTNLLGRPLFARGTKL